MSDNFECTPVGVDFLETSKNVFKAERVIKATPAQIFDVFEDAVSWTVWAPPIQKVEWTSAKPFGIGTTRTVSMVGGIVGYEEFVEWERGKRMAFTFLRCSKKDPEKFIEDYRVTDLGDGTCRVVWYMAMQNRGGPSWIDALTRPIMGLANHWMLGRFKKYVEKQVAM
jgi:hypothetical protein